MLRDSLKGDLVVTQILHRIVGNAISLSGKILEFNNNMILWNWNEKSQIGKNIGNSYTSGS